MRHRIFGIGFFHLLAALVIIESAMSGQAQRGYRPRRSPAFELEEFLARLPGPDTAASLEALDRVSTTPTKEARTALIERAFDSDRRSIRIAAAHVIAGNAVPSELPALIFGLDSPTDERREACAIALRGVVTPESRRALLDRLVFETSPTVRLAILSSLVDVGVNGEGDRILPFLTCSEPTIVLAAIRALGNGARTEQVAPLAEFLSHPDWRFQLAALDTIERCRCVDVVDAIIGAVPNANLRIAGAMRGVLTTLSGREIGPDPSMWSREIHRAKQIDVSVQPAAPGSSVRRRRLTGGRDAVRHYEVEAPTARVLFVLDVSDSMERPFGRGEFTPIEAVIGELERTLGNLSPTCSFNILAFSGDAVFWAEEARPAAPEAVEAARAWLRAFLADDMEMRPRIAPLTNVDLALVMAHGLPAPTPEKPEVDFDATPSPIADTLFFYSDGGANRGTFTSTTGLLGRVRSLHDATMVTIHTVVPEGRLVNVDLMKGIAGLTGGEVTYLDVRGRPVRKDEVDAASRTGTR